MPNTPNNATVVETCARRIRAMDAYVDRAANIGINGRKHAHTQVVAVYQRCLDARAKVAKLRAQLAEAVDEVGETEVARMEADGALKAWVRAEFGVESAEANDFGFPAPKKAVLTTEQKALAVERGESDEEGAGHSREAAARGGPRDDGGGRDADRADERRDGGASPDPGFELCMSKRKRRGKLSERRSPSIRAAPRHIIPVDQRRESRFGTELDACGTRRTRR